MPVFEIQGPDGSIYEVDAPDERAAVSGFQQFVGGDQAVATDEPSVAADVLKSAGAGLADGAIGLLTLPRAIEDGVGWAFDKGVGLLRGSPVTDGEKARREAVLDETSLFRHPSAEQVKSNVEALTGEFYQPQTTAGEFARTAGEFAVGGAASMPRNAIRGALQFGVIPGVASEAAGQATEGTAAEPYARTAAALAAGIGASAIPNRVGRFQANQDLIRTAPSRDDLRAQSRAAYQQAENSGVVAAPQAIDDVASRIVQKVTNEGFHPRIHGKTGAALQTIFEDVAEANGLPIDRLELLRRRIGAAANSLEPDERRIATLAREAFDDEIENLRPQDLFAGSQGDLTAATDALKVARDNWRRQSKSEMIQEAIIKAEDRAASTGTGGNLDNALRQNLRRLLDNPKTRRMFTKDEQDALRQAARASSLANIMRSIGRLSPTTGGLSSMLGIGGALAAPQFAIPAMAIGAAAKPVGEALTRRNANVVDALVRSGGRRAAPVSIDPRERIAQALAATQPLRSPDNEGIRVTIPARVQ